VKGTSASLSTNMQEVMKFTMNIVRGIQGLADGEVCSGEIRLKLPLILAGVNAYYMLAKSAEQYYDAL
jgi:hypothetical protein